MVGRNFGHDVKTFAFQIIDMHMLCIEAARRTLQRIAPDPTQSLDLGSIYDPCPGPGIVRDEIPDPVQLWTGWVPDTAAIKDTVPCQVQIKARSMCVFAGFMAELHAGMRLIGCFVF